MRTGGCGVANEDKFSVTMLALIDDDLPVAHVISCAGISFLHADIDLIFRVAPNLPRKRQFDLGFDPIDMSCSI